MSPDPLGYKNHVSVDRKHKIIRRYSETDASVHDSQKLDEILDKSNTGNEVWANIAYRSAETEAKLRSARSIVKSA
jgi:IS5 family transposase